MMEKKWRKGERVEKGTVTTQRLLGNLKNWNSEERWLRGRWRHPLRRETVQGRTWEKVIGPKFDGN